MKFRKPAVRDSGGEPSKPTLTKVSTMPVFRDRKSKANLLNTDIAPVSDEPRSAASEVSSTATGTMSPPPPAPPGHAVLKKRRTRSFLSGSSSKDTPPDGARASREDVPSVPSMPMKYLKRKLSRPNLGNGSESSGDAAPVPDVPAVPLMPTTTNTTTSTASSSFLMKRRQPSKPNAVEAEWTPGDDGRIVSKKDILREKMGSMLKSRATIKLETKRVENARAAQERSDRTSPILRGGANTNLERPQTSQGERRPSKAYDISAAASRSPSRTRTPNIPTETPAELAKKLLSMEQVRAMSVGAPCFGVEECNGRYKPQVMFRGTNAETSAEFAKDYSAYGHVSFAACTLGLSEEEAGRRSGDSVEDLVFEDDDAEVFSKPFADLMEIPNMLGSQGLDPGTVGFEYFLQMPIADSLSRADESDVSDKRDLLSSAPGELGLRPLNIEILISRLTELGQLYAASKEPNLDSAVQWNETKIDEMGVELFGRLLSADSGGSSPVIGGVIPMSTQIRALQRVLRTSGLWRDFGLVEWRARLGQLLWEAESAESNAHHSNGNGPCERDVLLLQITLAAELLLRLNVVRLMSTYDPILSRRDVKVLERQRTAKINWDMLLAERFLENIDISPNTESLGLGSGGAADRNSLISAIPFLIANDGADIDDAESLQPLLTPKNSTKQLEGLRHFSETLQWPHIDALPRRTTEEADADLQTTRKRFSRVPSTYLTPMSTPQLGASSPGRMSRSSSTFGAFGLEETPQPALSKAATASEMQLMPAHRASATPDADGEGNVTFDNCGWLSRSWISGLVMPGEAASQFLISTLLENSPQALKVLGDGANPYGGFQYQGRIYWSKGSVVGRVLAARKGARECMEWVSVPQICSPSFGDGKEGEKGLEDGWISVAVKEMPDAKHKPRIMSPEAVARDSDLLRNKSFLGTARQGDFTWPNDELPILGNEVVCQGLTFKEMPAPAATKEGDTTASTKTRRSIATLTFSSTIKRKVTVVEIPLLYDASFISSYPCHPKTAKATPSPIPPRPQAVPQLARPSPKLSPFPFSSTDNTSNKENKDPNTARATSSNGKQQPTPLERPKTAPAPADSGYASKQTSASTISFTTACSFNDDLLSPNDAFTSTPSSPPGTGGTTILTPIHPLHVDYHYDIVPLTTLFTAAIATATRARATSVPSTATATASPTPPPAQPAEAETSSQVSSAAEKEVMILDCRGGADLELFARAWCAKVGENALVGKEGRTCLACCVREARAVGVCVVLRT